jgi:hypothetical protein
MSCWVVPAIAAEMWGVTIDRILAGVLDGTVASLNEHGFVFVDVAPQIQTHPVRRPGEPAPATYVVIERDPEETFPTLYDQAVVSAQEAAFLVGADTPVDMVSGLAWMQTIADDIIDGRVGESTLPAPDEPPAHVEDPEIPPLDDEEDASPLPPREAMRAAVGRLRRPPPRPPIGD